MILKCSWQTLLIPSFNLLKSSGSLIIVIIWNKSKKLNLTNYQRKGITLLMILVGVQFLLGVLTIIMQVPVWLGVAHQVGAFILLSIMTFTLHRFSK